MLKFVNENNLVANPGKYKNAQNMNCLHFAVMKNQPHLAKYLLDQYPQLASQPDRANSETPLFYTLAKHTQVNTRQNLSQLFLDYNERASKQKKQVVDLLAKNKDGKTVYEAYNADSMR